MKEIVLFLILLYVSNAEVPLTSFFSYGTANGDAELERIDDGSTPPQNLSVPFPFFNIPQSTLWVNENGIITFERKSAQFTPYCKPVQHEDRMIAPFWADIDIRHTGNIFYRQTKDPAILKKGEHEIAQAFTDEQNINLKWAFIATWKDVTYFQDLGNHNESERKSNTFQATLLTDGVQSFVIFYYNKIEWTTGDVSGGQDGLEGTPAEIGYDYGDNLNYVIVNDSCKDSVINMTGKSNVGNAGQWIFKLSQSIETSPTPFPGCEDFAGEFCAIPNTIDYIGAGMIDIYGIQLTSTESAICRFTDPGSNVTEFDAEIITLSHITCYRPVYIFTIGKLPLEIEVFDAVSKNISRVYNGQIFVQLIQKDQLSVKLINNNFFLKWNPKLFSVGGLVKTAIGFGVAKLCTAAGAIKKAAKVFYYDSKCYIDENILMQGNVTCNSESRVPWWLNACPGAEPIPDYSCTAVGTLVVTSGYNLVKSEIITMGGVLMDFAVGVGLECGSRLGECAETLHHYQHLNDRFNSDVTNDTIYYFPDDVPHCPPTLALAQHDPTFVVDRLCTDSSNCLFNSGADICYISATPSPSGGAQQCCYSKGAINITHPAAGHPMIFHPSIQMSIPNIAVDRDPFNDCCNTILYPLYHDLCKRPTDPGNNYSNPQPSLGNGDTHFTTFDGLYYTFNGAGEFWLLKNSTNQSLAVQTRMIPGSSYSMVGAYAMKTPNSSVLQIEQTENDEFSIFYDSVRIPSSLWKKGINFDDIYVGYDNSVIVTFSSEFSFKISTWMVNSFAPSHYYGNYTKGILGSYDGNPFNDLTTPDGILLPANSSTEIIHYKFGLKWSVTEGESLFNYFGKNYSDYNFPEFKPSFGYSAGELPPNAAEICGDDQSCLWDLVTTGDEGIANQTRNNNEDFNQTVSTTSQNITMCPILDAIVNGSFVLSNYLPNSVATFSCDNGFELQGNSTLICMSDGQWNGKEPFCEIFITTTIESTSEAVESSSNSSPQSTSTTSSTSITTTSTVTTATTSNAATLTSFQLSAIILGIQIFRLFLKHV